MKSTDQESQSEDVGQNPSGGLPRCIQALGVNVHNLKNIDVTIPHGQWVAICGPSGSGKTSLALDTLYAEGQRRYIASFSAYTRQYLDVMEKPNARAILGIPPAIAVTRTRRSTTGRATVGSTTETLDYLREVFAKIAKPVCQQCDQPVRRYTSDHIADLLAKLVDGSKAMIGFSWKGPDDQWCQVAQHLLLAGFSRASVDGQAIELAKAAAGDGLQVQEEPLANTELPVAMALEELGWQSVLNPAAQFVDGEVVVQEVLYLPKKRAATARAASTGGKPKRKIAKAKSKVKSKAGAQKNVKYAAGMRSGSSDNLDEPSAVMMTVDVVVDRIVVGTTERSRIIESIETAMAFGGKAFVWLNEANPTDTQRQRSLQYQGFPAAVVDQCLGMPGLRCNFSDQLQCGGCNQFFPLPTPPLFSYNSPMGACSVCEGFGSISRLDIKLIVPDPRKTIREGAVQPWTTPKYKAKWRLLLSIADEIGLPVDVPFQDLNDVDVKKVWEGSSKHRFGGLNGFFRWLEKRKYKMHYRIFLARWRSYFECEACHGRRLGDKSLQFKIDDKSIADVCEMKLSDALPWLRQLELDLEQRAAVRTVVPQVTSRMQYLCDVGLSYVSLQRTLKTLSGGELQRTALTTALGSSLVNMLYVLDEPSVGLHPRDVARLTAAIGNLHAGGNTVVTVEHEPAMLAAVDRIIEIGPAAGADGGNVVFDGILVEMKKDKASVTARFLQHISKEGSPQANAGVGNVSIAKGKKKAGLKAASRSSSRRKPTGWLELNGATGNNLKNVSVKVPTGVLCLVTGVSGSGKSSLIRQTLYPALWNQLSDKLIDGLPLKSISVPQQIDEVIMIDDSPIGRSPRSNPVTYLKAFEPIRALFASTLEAKARNFTAGSFSFNVDGGRCTKCQGDGSLSIDMQFMPDVYMQCPECQGTRYQKELLEVTVRDKSIHEVLGLTVRQAFGFFRGHSKIQSRLKPLIDVGLEYVNLGQGAPTLSAGESQRLKLAAYLGVARKKQTLFILDEPSTGLHPIDIQKLIECFSALLDVGHSLLVIEHNTQLMSAADYIIDVGPESSDEGGTIVAAGAPEELVECVESVTGQYLKAELEFWKEQSLNSSP